MTRTALLALAATALAACSPHGSSEAPPPKLRHVDAPVVAGVLPPPPAWAQPFMGKIITQALPVKEICSGNADASAKRLAGPPAGSRVGGWGWDKQAGRPVARILLTDETLRVWGAGEGGAEERKDVPRRMPEVHSAMTGWRGFATGTLGLVIAYGLVDDGRAVCPLGEIEL